MPTADPPAEPRAYNLLLLIVRRAMTPLQELADRVERLVLRHEELKRASALLEQQLVTVVAERDSLKSRLSAARSRIDALIARLPADDHGLMSRADRNSAP